MDPFSVVNSTQAIGRRFSFYIAVQVASVLAPGVVVIVGVLFLVELFQHRLSNQTAQSFVRDISGTAGLLASLFILAAGYVAGYVIRELAFKLLAQLERLPNVQEELEVNVYARIEKFFPAQVIDNCFKFHPFLSQARKDSEAESRQDTNAQRRRTGGGHVETINYESFVYAKLWIRNYAPGFSVDNVEAEINILASGLAPGLLTGLIIIAVAHLVWWSVLVAVFVVALIWAVLLSSLIRLRYTETSEAIRNLVLDYAMRQAMSSYPSSQTASDDQPE